MGIPTADAKQQRCQASYIQARKTMPNRGSRTIAKNARRKGGWIRTKTWQAEGSHLLTAIGFEEVVVGVLPLQHVPLDVARRLLRGEVLRAHLVHPGKGYGNVGVRAKITRHKKPVARTTLRVRLYEIDTTHQRYRSRNEKRKQGSTQVAIRCTKLRTVREPPLARKLNQRNVPIQQHRVVCVKKRRFGVKTLHWSSKCVVPTSTNGGHLAAWNQPVAVRTTTITTTYRELEKSTPRNTG